MMMSYHPKSPNRDIKSWEADFEQRHDIRERSFSNRDRQGRADSAMSTAKSHFGVFNVKKGVVRRKEEGKRRRLYIPFFGITSAEDPPVVFEKAPMHT
jgi:hypothetical protein